MQFEGNHCEATRLVAATLAKLSTYISRSVCLQLIEPTPGSQANCSLKASVAKEGEPLLQPPIKYTSMLLEIPKAFHDPDFECGICLDA